jgi:hypothetical protein
VFAFIGIPDIETVRAEGVAIRPEPKAAAIAAAKREIANLKAERITFVNVMPSRRTRLAEDEDVAA